MRPKRLSEAPEQETDIVLYTIDDMQRIFKCKQRFATNLMNSPGFPSFKINRNTYVEKRAFEEWIARNKGRHINIQ